VLFRSAGGRAAKRIGDTVPADAILGIEVGEVDPVKVRHIRTCGAGDGVTTDQRIKGIAEVKAIVIKILNGVTGETVVAVGKIITAYQGYTIVATDNGVIAEGIAVALGITGAGGISSGGAYNYTCIVLGSGGGVNIDGTVIHHIGIRIIQQLHTKTIFGGGAAACGNDQIIKDDMIRSIQLDHRTLIAIGGSVCKRLTVAVKGNSGGGGCAGYRGHVQLLRIGTAARCYIKDHIAVDAALNVVIGIVKRVKVMRSRRIGGLGFVNGESAGYQCGRCYLHAGGISG